MRLKNVFATRWGIIGVGLFIGVFAAFLQKLGNPGNMGVCVACFERDIAGALGLHRAGVAQYIQPEIIGFVIGTLIAAYLFKEYRPLPSTSPPRHPVAPFHVKDSGEYGMVRAANMKRTFG